MSVKLFIGTTIEPGMARQLCADAKRYAQAAGWRWNPIGSWHITSLFIGQREEGELPGLIEAAEQCSAQHGQLVLEEGSLVTMPEEIPTMLWTRFDPSAALDALHTSLAKATTTPPSHYAPLWPHITMARGKGPPICLPAPVLVPSLVLRELTLFRSDPAPAGTIHTALHTWKLGQHGTFTSM